MSKFMRVGGEDIIWVDLDHVTSIRDDCRTRDGKTTYKIAVWTADSNNPLMLHGHDAINVMRELGLPLSVTIEEK